MENEILKITDWESKAKDTLAELEETLFDGLRTVEVTEVDENGVAKTKPQKKTFKKNEIMPDLTPMKVESKLYEILNVELPMDLVDAQKLSPNDFFNALKWYMWLITQINEYIVFVASKQTFCIFMNITTNVYNELYKDINYMGIIQRAEDYFISGNYLGSQSGLLDKTTTLSKLQTKDAGHNLVKNPESVVQNAFITLDRRQIDKSIANLEGMVKGIGGVK